MEPFDRSDDPLELSRGLGGTHRCQNTQPATIDDLDPGERSDDLGDASLKFKRVKGSGDAKICGELGDVSRDPDMGVEVRG